MFVTVVIVNRYRDKSNYYRNKKLFKITISSIKANQ